VAASADRQSSRQRARRLLEELTEREREVLACCVNRTQAGLLAHDAGIVGS
jgi:FixJ family two-component response regulator